MTAFHHVMRHGVQLRRTGGRYPSSHFLDEVVTEPLRIIANAWEPAQVLLPGVTLIVSDLVKSKLREAQIPRIGFADVEVSKWVFQPYVLGDRSFYRRADYLRNPSPDAPRQHMQALPAVEDKPPVQYHELLLCRYPRVVASFSSLTTPSVVDQHPDAAFHALPTTELRLSEELINEFPMLWTPEGILLTETSAATIRPHLDWNYFSYRVLSI